MRSRVSVANLHVLGLLNSVLVPRHDDSTRRIIDRFQVTAIRPLLPPAYKSFSAPLKRIVKKKTDEKLREQTFSTCLYCAPRYVAIFSMRKKWTYVCDLINRRLVDIRQTICQKFVFVRNVFFGNNQNAFVIMRGKLVPNFWTYRIFSKVSYLDTPNVASPFITERRQKFDIIGGIIMA